MSLGNLTSRTHQAEEAPVCHHPFDSFRNRVQHTTYILTAYLRTPATTGTLEPSNLRVKPVVFHEGWMGVEDYGGSRLTRKFFHNWFQSYSIEFTTGSANKTATIFFNNTETQRGGLMHVDGATVVKMDDLRLKRVTD